MNFQHNPYFIQTTNQNFDQNTINNLNAFQPQSYIFYQQQFPYVQMAYTGNPLVNGYQPSAVHHEYIQNFPRYQIQQYATPQQQQILKHQEQSYQLNQKIEEQNLDQLQYSNVVENKCDQISPQQNICENKYQDLKNSNFEEQMTKLNENNNIFEQNQQQQQIINKDFRSSDSTSSQNHLKEQILDSCVYKVEEMSEKPLKVTIDSNASFKKYNLSENFSFKSSLSEQIYPKQEDTQGSIIFNLSPKEICLLKQLPQINIQNAFKNILKAFISHINYKFKYVYVYESNIKQNYKKDTLHIQGDVSAVRKIENPTPQQKKMFIQKFNKFIKNKKYNNTSIRQIIENRLYSSVLKEYIQTTSQQWIRESSFQNKEDILVVLEFFKMCCDNQNLLLFLSKTNEKLIPLSNTQQQ